MKRVLSRTGRPSLRWPTHEQTPAVAFSPRTPWSADVELDWPRSPLTAAIIVAVRPRKRRSSVQVQAAHPGRGRPGEATYAMQIKPGKEGDSTQSRAGGFTSAAPHSNACRSVRGDEE